MSMDRMQRILGVTASYDPATILGLTDDACTPIRIDEALLRRLNEVMSHPDGRSPDAQEVRIALRRAADELKQRWIASHAPGQAGAASSATRHVNPTRLHAATNAFQLTMFDRQVMAALVAGGGWNAPTRSQIVALASAYNVSAEGLVRVVRGLSEYAKSGGPQLSVTQITAGASRLDLPSAAKVAPDAPIAWLRRVAPELRGEAGAWGIARLATALCLVIVAVGIWLIVLAARWAAEDSNRTAVEGEITPPGAALTSMPNLPARRAIAPPGAGEPDVRALPVDPWPTFRGEPIPPDAGKALAETPGLAEAIEKLARDFIINQEPTERMIRQWRAGIATVSGCWMLLDPAELAGFEDRIAEVVAAAGTRRAFLDPIMDAMTLTKTAAGAANIWRDGWTCAMLGRIASETDLPSVTIAEAKMRLAAATSGALRAEQVGRSESAAAWLEAQAAALARNTSPAQNQYDAWEAWIGVCHQLTQDSLHDEAILSAIESVLATDVEMDAGHPLLNVLGRLLDESDLNGSEIARIRIAAMFESETSRVSARSLWVLTSLLSANSKTPWFDSEMIVPPSATASHRRRLWTKIEAAWPGGSVASSSGPNAIEPLRIDPDLLKQWVAALRTVSQAMRPGHSAGLMEHLLAVAWINEAAMHMAAGQPADATKVLSRIAELIDPDSAEPAMRRFVADQRPQPGQVIGVDGQWAAAYQQADNNNDSKLQQFEALRRSAGTDLGPIDAHVLVREAYRGRTPDVRAAAQMIIVGRFATGPNVLLEMLDQLPDAPITESLSDCIARVTTRVLPAIRSSHWGLEARTSLVERTMLLRPSPNDLVDFAATELAASYGRQIPCLTGAEATQHFVAAEPAADQLLDAWRKRVEKIHSASPAPAELHVLAARHRARATLADGPIQRFVAAQLSVLDLLTYQTVAENPPMHRVAMNVLAESSRRRSTSLHVLDQSVEAELAMARIWSIRFGIAPDETPGDSEAVR